MANSAFKTEWTYSELGGSEGAWERDSGDGYIRIACTTLGGRIWQARVIRFADGEDMFYAERPTLAAAMDAADSARV